MKTIAACLMLVVTLGSFEAIAVTPEAVDVAGRQRMLTQKMTKEVLLFALDSQDKSVLKALKGSHDLFDNSLRSLKLGNSSLNIPKAKSNHLPIVADIEARWAEFSKIVTRIIDTQQVLKKDTEYLHKHNIPLLKASNKLVVALASASGGNTDEVKLKRVNLAGKQRMLSQRVAKQALFSCYYIDYFGSKQQALETISEFEIVLAGLMAGNQILGLEAASSDVELNKLIEVGTYWRNYMSAIKPAMSLEYSVCDKPMLQSIKTNSLTVLKTMNQAVQITKRM